MKRSEIKEISEKISEELYEKICDLIADNVQSVDASMDDLVALETEIARTLVRRIKKMDF